MKLHFLDDKIWFPPVEEALDDGLLAFGGDLSPERLLLAYQSGIFPWFSEGEPPLWWSPDPRFVLFPRELKVSNSMKQVLRSGKFTFTVNKAFVEVIRNCQAAERRGQDGTWITDDIVAAYCKMHELGYAHSAEAWVGDRLVGGLYGIRLGNAFFGESMFAQQSNASKYAFIQLVESLECEGVNIIDCQVYTEHLESLGARMIPRSNFLLLINSKIHPA